MESIANEYQLKQKGKEYVFSTSVVGNSVRLACKNPEGKIYSRDFLVNDLKSLSPIFNEITTESDAIDFIDKVLNIHKVGVHEEEGQIKINFYINIQDKVNQVEIPLGISGKAETLSSIPQSQTTNVEQNTIFENAPNIGPTIEDPKLIIQPAKSKVVTNPPKFLPVKILEPKFINSGEQLNEINQVNQYNIPSFGINQSQIENTNYLQTETNPINITNTINTTSYNDTSPHIQNISSNMDQIFKNVQPTNDPNIFLSAPIQGKSYTAITHTLTEAQPIIRQPAEMGNGLNNIESILRGSLLSENEVSNIKIIGDPKVIKKEPIKEMPGFEQEPISIVQFATPTISNIPMIIDNTGNTTNINNVNDYNQYFQQQPQVQKDFSAGISNFNQNYTENYIQNYQTESNPPVQTDFGNTNYLQPQTDINILPNIEGNMNNLQNYGESNLTKTAYLSDDLAQNRLSLKSQDERINKLEGDANSLRSEQQQMRTQINSLTGEINNYRNSKREINNLRAQNELYKKQLSELKKQNSESNEQKSQLSQTNPLKSQTPKMPSLKNQVIELNALKEKVQELSSIKPNLEELNILRQQVGEMNILKQQLNDLDSLRNRASDNEILKKKIKELEKLKLEYEQEIRVLREERRNTNFSNINKNVNKENNRTSVKKSSGMESKQITFEDKPEQFIVKGDIIQNADELEMIIRKINKLNRKITLNLLYKATADSGKAAAFHLKCDDAKSSIVLVETDKGKRFGGYTACSWSGDCIEKKDEDAFVFSLDKMKTYNNIPGEDAIGCYPKFGPVFLGCQIRIYDNAFTKGGTTFEKGLNYNTEEDYELTGGERTFKIKEIEVYDVITE